MNALFAEPLRELKPRSIAVFPTACPDDSLDARKTAAGGFLVKPLTAQSVREQLNKLRRPLQAGGTET